MKTKLFWIMLVITMAWLCSAEAEDNSICVDNRLVFQVENPSDYTVNIQFLDENIELLYQYELHKVRLSRNKKEKVVIDFSSPYILIKTILLNENGDVKFSSAIADEDDEANKDFSSLNYLITMTHTANKDIIFFSGQCYSSDDQQNQEKVEALISFTDDFDNKLNHFLSNLKALSEATEIGESNKEYVDTNSTSPRPEIY